MSSPVIRAVIGRTPQDDANRDSGGSRRAPVDRLRLDFLKKAPDFKRLLDTRPCPMIATFRRPADGGRWSGSEEERQMLIRQAVVAGFDYIDLEADVADHIPRFGSVSRIVSYHNLDETPDDLEAIEGAHVPARRRHRQGRGRR